MSTTVQGPPAQKLRFKPDTYAEELHIGLNGPRVRLLQDMLNKLITEGEPLVVDGQYGPKTKERVEIFQTRMQLSPVNGIATAYDFDTAADTLKVPIERLFFNSSCKHVASPAVLNLRGEGDDTHYEVINPEIVDLTMPRKDLPPLARQRKGVPLASPASRIGIVIHHSATPMDAKGSNPWGFASSHVLERKFPSIAYSMVVMPKGPAYKCLMPDEKGWHAGSRDFPGDENELYYGICFPGNFDVETMPELYYQIGVQSILWWVRFHRAYAQNSTWMPKFLRHSDLVKKSCPGKNFPFEQMTTDVNLILRGGR